MSESIGNSGPGMKLHTKILLGLAGRAWSSASPSTSRSAPTNPAVETINDYVAVPIGQIFLRMLFMVVMPLVFASIALGVAGLGDIRKVGRVGGKAIGYFFVTTVLAATLGLVIVNIIAAVGARHARDARRADGAIRQRRVDARRSGGDDRQVRHRHVRQHRAAQPDRRRRQDRHARRHLLRPDVRRGADADPGRERPSR